MKSYKIDIVASDIYKELWNIQDSANRTVATNKPNTTINTELVSLSEVDSEILELEAGKPYIKIEVGLVSVRGKVAKRSVYLESLDDANKFISNFDDVVIKG